MTEPHYSAWISWISGTIQTLLYIDFVYYFLTQRNARGDLPL